MKQEYSSDFETFWVEYPLKKGKGGAYDKWNQLKKKGFLPAIPDIVIAINNQRIEKDHLRKSNQFCPEWKNPKTWLHNKCWDDHCILPSPKKVEPPKQAATIGNLKRAYNILLNFGQDKFDEFCKGAHLTDYDRECVLNSYHHAFDAKVRNIASGLLKGV